MCLWEMTGWLDWNMEDIDDAGMVGERYNGEDLEGQNLVFWEPLQVSEDEGVI